MGAEQDVAAPVGDELEEPLLPVVDDGPLQPVVADGGHGDLGVALAGLRLGESDAGVVGVGEPAGGQQPVRGAAGGPEHRVRRGGLGLGVGGLHEHGLLVGVAGGEDVLDVGPEELVDGDRRAAGS